jgi:glucuronate isomerase
MSRFQQYLQGGRIDMNRIFEEIFNYVKDLEIIDTHEHLPCLEDMREKDTDVLKEYLTHYFSRDLISSSYGTVEAS